MLCADFTLVETVERVKNYRGTALGKGDKVVTIMQVKSSIHYKLSIAGADLGGGCRGCAPPPPPPPPEMTCGFLIQLYSAQKKLCGLLVLK